MKGLKVDGEEFKFKSYADDMVLTTLNPQLSVQQVVERIDTFRSFDYKNQQEKNHLKIFDKPRRGNDLKDFRCSVTRSQIFRNIFYCKK